jgi:hypothetical protein
MSHNINLPPYCILIFSFLSLAFGLNAEPNAKKSTPDTNNAEETENKEENKYKTTKPEKKDFRITLSLVGFFEDPDSIPYVIETDSWMELKVITPPLHGSLVSKNKNLLTLDLDKINTRLRDMKHELSILNLNQQILVNELKRDDEIQKIEISEINRNEKFSQKNFNHFKEVDLPHEKKSANFEFKRYEENLSYMLEELNQLKKMYESDDLTEETEEIIITRTQNDVNRARFALDGAKIRRDKRLSLEIPKMESEKLDAFQKEKLSFKTSKIIKPLEMRKKRLEIEKIQVNKNRLILEIREIEKDLDKMKSPSPIDGTIFIGKFDRGQWSGTKPFEQKLKKGGVLKPHEEFLTICPLKRIQARINLPEKHFHEVTKIKEGKLTATIYPDLDLECKIRKISKFPISPNIFDLILDVNLPKGTAAPVPGNSCSLEIVTYENKNALSLPASSVFKEDHDPELRYVYILAPNNKPIKRRVKVGKTSGSNIEILSGLKKSQSVLLNKPS